MRMLSRMFRFIYVIYAFLTFVLLMIPVFVWSICVLPFGRIKGGNLIYKACIVWADIWFALIFIRHKNIYQGSDNEISYIYVSNHISYLDAAIIPKTFRHSIRPLGKVEMAKVPIFGFIYRNTIVTVDRSSSANRSKSVKLLKSILSKGISVLVFPEGTFNMTSKPLKDFYDGAFRVAIETGTPIKPVLFLDAYTRMHYRSIFSLNPGISRSLFLPEITVSDLTIEDTQLLKEKVHSAMEKALLEYNAAWIKN